MGSFSVDCIKDCPYVPSCQAAVEEHQFIHLYAGILFALLCIDSVHNNPTISTREGSSMFIYVGLYMFSIEEDPDPLSMVWSNVVHHNVGPSCWYTRIYLKNSIWLKNKNSTRMFSDTQIIS